MPLQKDVAEHLDLSTQRIQTLTKQGVIPPAKGSKGYDLDECRYAYIRHLRGIASGHASEEGGHDLMTERARKEKWQADKTEIEVAVLRGELAPIEEVHRQWDELLSRLRARALGMPSKLTPAVCAAAQDFATVKNVIDGGVREWLEEMSNYEASATDNKNAAAAAEADGQRVGGRRAKTKQRSKRRTGAMADH